MQNSVWNKKKDHRLIILCQFLFITYRSTILFLAKNNKQDCKYGAKCREQSDPTHCSRFQHPATTEKSGTEQWLARNRTVVASSIYTQNGGIDKEI